MASERRRGVTAGLVGAMAMSGMRNVTTNLRLVERTPPHQVVQHGAPGLYERVPERYREAALELAHWAYGAAGGALYGHLPGPIRRRRLAGPLYGLASWAFFETVLADLVGIPRGDDPRLGERLSLIGDHVLYGAVLDAFQTD